MPVVTVKAGHVRPIWTGHPWVFAQAIQSIQGGAAAGDEVTVIDPQGMFLGRGLYTPRSAIAVRIFSRDPDVAIDGALFRRRIQRALARRHAIGLPSQERGRETTAFRLIHAEGDDLPGLVVDVYDDVVAVQLGTVGLKRREGVVFDALMQALSPRAIIDRTSPGVGKLEGFEPGSGVVRGDATVEALRFFDRGLLYTLPRELGQKTGYYLDQRPLRDRVEQLAHGKRVLDAFCFVGSFSMAAARGGAHEVLAVDQSALALEVASECARENGLAARIAFQRGDARAVLQSVAAHGGYDVVICDPPKLSPTRGSKDVALNAYRRLAADGCRATRPGGTLVLCSCSSAVGVEDLVRALALGARDANMSVIVAERYTQGPDHPVPAAFPEGLYLKSLVAWVDVR